MPTIIYHGYAMASLRADLLPQATVLSDEGPAALPPATPAPSSEPAQMPLMELPQSALKGVRRRGHAGRPGAGPEGETCGGCLHFVRRHSRGGKTFRKCALRKGDWTQGGGSDIRAKDPACERFMKPSNKGVG